jgi:hypothetical protein
VADERSAMSEATRRNRLDEEESPYLRQHADNPVNWQPWDEQALAAARERDVPIFLSIGYSACHWCHVMEEESFQDEAVAELLNDAFVPIKVDREERPDLDRIYQTICQLVSGRGGWPLSVWLTPEGEPFYVGTYFPPEPRQGAPGFQQLLTDIANSWEDDREEIQNRAEQWTTALTDQLEDTPDVDLASAEEPDSELLGEAAAAAIRGADRDFGGFGRSGPKFPHPGRIELLLRARAVGAAPDAAAVAAETLEAMADGGIYDHVGGGFHRYATDRSWTVPHFEKMLYDNAELPRVYLAAARAFDEPRYARIAQETLAFVERELTSPDGAFYSTLDAVSEPPASRVDGGEESDETETQEGAFYVWTPAEVRDAIADETTADLACDRFGVDAGGNFERGTTVLTISETVADLAESYDLPESAVRERLTDARIALFEARSDRPRPARDEKVLAGWNGLMISAFAEGARTLDPAFAEQAEAALSFVREHLWNPQASRLSRRYKDGDVKGEGYLEDYAFLARGAFDLYGVTGDVAHLAFALDLARTIESEFWDADAGTVYFTPESGEQLVARPQELTDQSTPSSLGVTTNLLLDLAHFSTDDGFAEIAETVLSTHADRIRGSPLEHVSLVLAADKRDRGATELTLVADDAPDPWREQLSEAYLSGAVLAPRPATEAGLEKWLSTLGLQEAPPIWRGRDADGGEPTVYACANFTCSPPKRDVAEALEWLGGSASE